MRLQVRCRRRGAASATGLLIVLTMFGVLLMHSVTPTTPMAGPMPSSMSGGHASMSPTSAVESAVPVAFGKHDCPSAHQMMHPCAGTTVSWPALTVPTLSFDIDLAPTTASGIGSHTDSARGRAPPWTLWELDRSVTLRV
ncbi:DUF6153 family protein [Rhodococcus sp. P1Y]|uniref:DUF6153 family protein n=1 Tax=Rhodococcus sp. P1Y TaxID=1302308 RepID=UPI000EB2B920|nr:DUF6153 family protein [Rhodococcus sp. P1Y]AYJ49769.1 hypothetical protein D8W71_17320 [Rhodococcus sp. P1Y]